MQCPGCNHFASNELGDPEVNLEVTEDKGFVTVTADVLLSMNSECCGEQLKEGQMFIAQEIRENPAIKEHLQGAPEHIFEVEFLEDSCSEFGSRRKRHIAVDISYELTCSCDDPKKTGSAPSKRWSYSGKLSDTMSYWDLEDCA